jgi:hypothetical protein
MINFYDKVNRLFKVQTFLIKKYVFSEDGIDYGLLKKLSIDLTYQSLIDSGLKAPVFSLLFNNYEKGLSIDDYIIDPKLYLSERQELAKLGIIEVIEIEDDWISFPEIKIIDKKEFYEFTSKIKKDFAFLILYKKRMQLLVSLLDEIYNKGPFNSAEIQKIYDSVQDSSIKIQKYIKQNNPKKTKVSEKNESLITTKVVKSETQEKQIIGKYRTFLIKNAEFNPEYFNLTRNDAAVVELWNDMTQAGLIGKITIENFKKIFINFHINKENRIVWLKSIKSLVEFVKALINSKQTIEFNGVDHWLVTKECFILKNSKEISFEALYKPQSADSKNKQEIERIVKNFISKLV